MNIDEAIATLEAIKQFGMGKWMFDKEEIEAFDMAIEALSKPTCKKCTDLISREEASKAIEAETTEAWTESDADFNRGMDMAKSIVESLPSAEPKTDEEDELKFYYVESIDDYWIGARNDNFYYANWHEGLGFVWSHSRYLPWGEHIVDENTLWKEHTYPSEPFEIPFTVWIDGFVKKYFTEPRTGEWIPCNEKMPEDGQGVIICTDDKRFKDHFVGTCIYEDGSFHTNFYDDISIIAWMQLPEPYREDGEV